DRRDDAEIVDGGEVARLRSVLGQLRQQRAATLRQRLQQEGGGQGTVRGHARIGRGDMLQEHAAALADLEDPIEQQEGGGVRKPRERVLHLAHHAASNRTGRHIPPRARPSTTATRTGQRRAVLRTTSSPLGAGAPQPTVGGTRPWWIASAAAATPRAPAVPKSPVAPRGAVTGTCRRSNASASASASTASSG